jgi:hypothetical protein
MRSNQNLTTGVEWTLVVTLTQRFGTLDIQVHDNRLLAASDNHGLTRHIWAGVDFLMWDVRRNINEISGFGFVAEL